MFKVYFLNFLLFFDHLKYIFSMKKIYFRTMDIRVEWSNFKMGFSKRLTLHFGPNERACKIFLDSVRVKLTIFCEKFTNCYFCSVHLIESFSKIQKKKIKSLMQFFSGKSSCFYGSLANRTEFEAHFLDFSIAFDVY
jgi:hypothetical protein